MTDDLVIDYSEPWRETETFLRLLPGPMFSTPPADENGVVIRHYSTTVSRKLRDHPKMRVDLSDPDDREIVAKRVCRGRRPAYVGVLLSRIEQMTRWRKRRDGRLFPVDYYRRTNRDIEYRQALWCDIEGDDIDDQFRRLSNMPLRPTMAVWSGNRSIQAYWILSRPVTDGAFRRLMDGLCDRLRGNRNVLRPMQQMCLPGGVHEKTGVRAALVLAGERYYRARQVADALALPEK
jgi:hypothetical protein